MRGIIKTPASLLKCHAVFGVLAQLSTFPELFPLTKPGLLANKLNRPTQGLFSSAEWLGPSGPIANGSLSINLCPHVSAIYRLYFISKQNNKCEALYLGKLKEQRRRFSRRRHKTNLFGFTTRRKTGWFGCSTPSSKREGYAWLNILDLTFVLYITKIFCHNFWGRLIHWTWMNE